MKIANVRNLYPESEAEEARKVLGKWRFDDVCRREEISGAGAIGVVTGNVSLMEQELGRIQVVMLAREFCFLLLLLLLSYSKRGGQEKRMVSGNLRWRRGKL